MSKNSLSDTYKSPHGSKITISYDETEDAVRVEIIARNQRDIAELIRALEAMKQKLPKGKMEA